MPNDVSVELFDFPTDAESFKQFIILLVTRSDLTYLLLADIM